jgi:hypothetical protein
MHFENLRAEDDDSSSSFWCSCFTVLLCDILI